jgi:hypothetical protein
MKPGEAGEAVPVDLVFGGGDTREISTWISNAKAQRLAAEAELRRTTTRSRIADLISEVSDLAATLRGAESETTAEACRQLGLRLTYYPDKQLPAPQQHRSQTI